MVDLKLFKQVLLFMALALIATDALVGFAFSTATTTSSRLSTDEAVTCRIQRVSLPVSHLSAKILIDFADLAAEQPPHHAALTPQQQITTAQTILDLKNYKRAVEAQPTTRVC